MTEELYGVHHHQTTSVKIFAGLRGYRSYVGLLRMSLYVPNAEKTLALIKKLTYLNIAVIRQAKVGISVTRKMKVGGPAKPRAENR